MCDRWRVFIEVGLVARDRYMDVEYVYIYLSARDYLCGKWCNALWQVLLDVVCGHDVCVYRPVFVRRDTQMWCACMCMLL